MAGNFCSALGAGIVLISATLSSSNAIAHEAIGPLHAQTKGIPLLTEGYEEPFIPGRRWQFAGNTTATRVGSPTRAGEHSMHFLLNWARDKVNYRTELNLATPNEFFLGKEYWYSFSVFVPADWQPDSSPDIIFQIHARPDTSLGEGPRYPPLTLQAQSTGWFITQHSAPERVNTNSSDSLIWRLYRVGSVAPGKWTDWVLHARWSYGPEGSLSVWKDGRPVLNEIGPNAYNDLSGMYLKIGIYKPQWKDTRTPPPSPIREYFFDEIEVTTGALSDAPRSP